MNKYCPDCGTGIDQIHFAGCDVERCSVCHGQRLQCECRHHEPWESRWTGEWPGVAECRERGWYTIMVPSRGWVACAPDTEGAFEDLNRWTVFAMTGYDPYA